MPRPGRANLLFDALLALVVCASLVSYVVQDLGGDPPPYLVPGAGPGPVPVPTPARAPVVVLAALASLPLALRRRFPLAVLWIVLAATALTPDGATRATFYGCVIAAYSAAAYSPYRVATLASLPLALPLLGRGVGDVPMGSFSGADPTVPLKWAPVLVAVPVVIAAVGLRSWKLRAAESAARLAAVEREQAEALRRAVDHERARIARELHDVVTHNVSVMVIQAGAARTIMESSPDRAREALLAVEAGGRAAMGELRHVMGLLTPDTASAEGAESLEPQPGLGQLAGLVDRMRAAGTPVELAFHGEAGRSLGPGVELAAYRVVQEALTNTVKHASGARAAVTVTQEPGTLCIEVTDTGGTPGPAAGTGNGRGLLGLRERLAVYGGTLHTGTRPLGGYRVRALIPLEPAFPPMPALPPAGPPIPLEQP
ncbi:histidine kinase [Streptomyces sp. NPDC005811]|uniref:sensor histidine kinase n=1 Tax=Streptomyces sp. NPDC005811 TaxID=3154565 RepID=UPI0033CE53C8